ncbi:hypothetical protein GF402_01625 [Candidatus Fermentibacteria bacterium]|nr:hypothetical protein [Candidatus Fermentibacteria bacterium]
MGIDDDAGVGGRAGELIESLGLIPHPEGGYYLETFRSRDQVRSERGLREALTDIYFLLVRGRPNRFHRHPSDEVWHYLEGGPLEILVLDPSGLELTVRNLRGDRSPKQRKAVVRGGWWQAARTSGDFTLVSCTVGPGFQFSDLEMLSGLPEAEEVLRKHPDLSALV